MLLPASVGYALLRASIAFVELTAERDDDNAALLATIIMVPALLLMRKGRITSPVEQRQTDAIQTFFTIGMMVSFIFMRGSSIIQHVLSVLIVLYILCTLRTRTIPDVPEPYLSRSFMNVRAYIAAVCFAAVTHFVHPYTVLATHLAMVVSIAAVEPAEFGRISCLPVLPMICAFVSGFWWGDHEVYWSSVTASAVFFVHLITLQYVALAFVAYEDNQVDAMVDQIEQGNMPVPTFEDATFEEDPPPNCAICLEPMTPEKHPVVLPCEHTFCRQCIGVWYVHKPTCPNCRTDLALLVY